MEARKKVAKVVLSFVIVFMICWLPRHTYILWFHYDPGLYNMFWHVFKIIGFCLSFINSCINPLALYFLSKQFRRYYNRYLFCCCQSQKTNKKPSTQDYSATMCHYTGPATTTRRTSGTTMTMLPTQTMQTSC